MEDPERDIFKFSNQNAFVANLRLISFARSTKTRSADEPEYVF